VAKRKSDKKERVITHDRERKRKSLALNKGREKEYRCGIVQTSSQ
jgi:hypothetical protein